MEKVAGVHRDADLPKYHAQAPSVAARQVGAAAGQWRGPGLMAARRCSTPPASSNYNNPDIGLAARAVLAKNGVETEVVYPRCCGMPQLEQGDIAAVADSAKADGARSQAVDRQGL